jgi:hypothetical protein
MQDTDLRRSEGALVGSTAWQLPSTSHRRPRRAFRYDGQHRIAEFDVTAVEDEHKGGRTFGLRAADGQGSFAYLPDHAPAPEVSARADIDAVRGGRAAARRAVPRSRASDGLGLWPRHRRRRRATRASCGVRRLVLIQHSPARTDDALDDIADWVTRLAGDLPVVVAYEGMWLEISGAGQESRVTKTGAEP